MAKTTNAATADNGRRALIQAPTVHNEGVTVGQFLIVWVASTFINLLLIGIIGGVFFFLGKLSANEAPPPAPEVQQTADVDDQKKEFDLTNTDLGDDTNLPLAYNNDRIEEVSVPGKVDPTAPIGVPGAPEAAPMNVPPPPGTGGGTGAAVYDPNISGTGSGIGTLGGMGGTFNVGGGFGGRSGSTRVKMLAYGGGNSASEAAVARGLQWLALHQCADGHWSLNQFNRFARTAPIPAGKVQPDNSTPMTNRNNDTAGTAFGLLPFLAAGITHKSPPEKNQKDYRKGVGKAIEWMMANQSKSGSNRGFYGGDMYSHGLATIAMCEAFALSADQRVKISAQMAIDYLVAVQHPGGGWRYTARQAGDTSVTGWQLMALRSGQMAGLKVPSSTLAAVKNFLDSCESSDRGGYGYVPGAGPTPTMTAVGGLCRQYLGVPKKNESLIATTRRLREMPPASTTNIYYLYYATQVMHHMDGKDWDFWNLGPKGDGKGGIRDTLIARQGKAGANVGSFEGDDHVGGRLGATSLSLLTLEVYYRHLPLYRQATNKNMAEPPGPAK